MKVLKWIIGIIMVFVLLTGVSLLGTVISAQKYHPQSASDLGVVNVTIKSISLTPGVPGPQMLTPDGYYTKFIVPHAPAETNIKDLAALTGQHADVYLRKKDIALLKTGLQQQPLIIAYGIVLDNGKVLSDPNAVLAANSGDSLLHVYMVMVLIPVFYFLFLYFFRGTGRRRELLPDRKRSKNT